MSRYVTAPVRKKDAMSLVTGMPVYTGDLVPAGALRVKLLRSPHARALVEAGHRMGFTILAEGVENDSQIDTLRQLRCDAFQGYRSSVPLPEAEARKRITQGAHLGDFTPVPLPPQ